MTASTFASFIAPLIGRAVIESNANGEKTRYTITHLSDKLGKLKDGSEGEYVVLSKDGETGVVINMHPNTAKKLITKGAGDKFELVPVEADNAGEPAAATSEPAAEQTASTDNVAAATESTGEPTSGPAAEQTASTDNAGEPPASTEPPAPKVPKVTKKSQTIEIFNEMTGKPRKEVIAVLKAKLGLSDNGANTYYQSVKSGAWK